MCIKFIFSTWLRMYKFDRLIEIPCLMVGLDNDGVASCLQYLVALIIVICAEPNSFV